MSSVTGPKPVVTMINTPATAATPAQTKAAEQPEEMSALAKHISFFQGDTAGVVNQAGTRKGLEALGLAGASVGFGGVALTAPFSIRQNKDKGFIGALTADTVNMNRIQEGVRADGTDTGVFNQKDGSLNVAVFEKFWKATAGDKGYLTDADLDKMINKKPKGSSEAAGLGPVSALEWALLRELAGQINTKGERVLTLNHVLAFYDGTLFQDLAKARESGTLYKPTGAVSHDGLKAVAKTLSSQALESGGVDAGEGGKANFAAHLAIDDAASLAYQQKTKTLGSTLSAAFKALCPAGKQAVAVEAPTPRASLAESAKAAGSFFDQQASR